MKNTPLRSLLVACAASLVAYSSAGAAVLVDFSTASDYNTGFTEINSNSDSFTYSSTNGVGGVPGRVNVTQGSLTDSTALYNVLSFNLSSAPANTISVFFLVPSPIGGAALITAAQVGFSEDLTQGFVTGANQDYVTARVRSSNVGSTYFMEGQYSNNGVAVNVDTTAAFTLTAGNWYKLSATFTDIGTSFSYTSTVEDYGTTGSSFVSLVQSISGTQLQTSLSNGTDTTAYGGFRANGNANNKVVAIDNFAVVPEPSTFALISVGLLSLAYLRKRSRTLKS